MKTYFKLLIVLLIVAGGSAMTGCERQTVQPQTESEQQQDVQITEKVTAALSNSPSFKFPDVQVATYKKTVQLSGFVLTSDQKRSAEEIAKATPGVVQVENKISVKE